MTQLSLFDNEKSWFVATTLQYGGETKYLIKSTNQEFTEYWTNDLSIPEAEIWQWKV